MKEKPIIFSAPMVRAILEGRKTQTRRIVKIPKWAIPGVVRPQPHGGIVVLRSETGADEDIAPPVQTGDVLWVRETGWERPFRSARDMCEGADTWERYYYDADGLTEADHEDFKRWGFKRRSSIFMPRWASRLRLPVKSVRVERLQDISEEDARAEGVTPFRFDPEGDCWTDGKYKTAFEFLWNEIHGWADNAWLQNPWVWVYEWEPVA